MKKVITKEAKEKKGRKITERGMRKKGKKKNDEKAGEE